jgi:ankyrin repeat protein
MARLNRLDELQEALQSGVNVNETDEFGATALHYAIAHKNAQAALQLIEHGADVTIGNRDGKTSLHSAIEYGLFDVAVSILRKNPNVVAIADRHGNQPLWTAAFNAKGRYELVELLLEHGADVNHRNNVGLCPLDVAHRKDDSKLLEVLQREA